MAGMKEKATHQDSTEFEGPVDTGNPHAKRPADQKKGDFNADTSVSSKDPGKVFDSGKVAEQVAALFADIPNLSEGFATKAATIVEGAISERVVTIREQIEQQFNERLEQAITEAASTFEDKLDSYLSYVVESFMKENQLAIDTGIKNEISEQVLASVAAIIEANGVTIPEDKIDVSEALAEEVADLETKLNEQMQANIELTEQVKKYQLAEAFDQVAGGLTQAQRDRLAALSESISFTDVEQYKNRVTTLRESVVEKKMSSTPQTITESSTPVNTETKIIDAKMQAYLAALRD